MKEQKKAAALKYDINYQAPMVTAAGSGYIAEKILEKAEEEKVPVIENKELADLLSKVEVGDNIPYELYDAVARVLAYVMEIDNLI